MIKTYRQCREDLDQYKNVGYKLTPENWDAEEIYSFYLLVDFVGYEDLNKPEVLSWIKEWQNEQD